MKKIFIPIDFSENSLNALAYARTLFTDVEATFYLFSAYTMKHSNLVNDQLENEWSDAMIEDVKEEINFVLDDVNRQNKNSKHTFKVVTKANLLADAVEETVISLDIDLIVMATKGAKGMREIFLGSNAVKVINQIDQCATLVVPINYEVKTPKQIVFSTNFKRPFTKEELKPLLYLLSVTNAELKIVQLMDEAYLDEVQQSNKQGLVSLLERIPPLFHKITYKTSETNAIRDFVKETQSDMISLIHHKHSFFYRLTNENVVEKTSFNSPVPLLVLPTIK